MAESEHEIIAQAQSAALKWLAVVDGQGYEEAWGNASELLRGAVAKEHFIQSLKGALEPFGEFRLREHAKSTYATTLPGAPDGEYVVIEYTSTFENKRQAVETVTPMREPDGSWRVSGYYIR